MKLLKIILILTVLITVSCRNNTSQSYIDEAYVDLDSIERRGTLKVVTDYNTINYFVHKDVAVGYQYELVHKYAAHLGVEVELQVSNDNEQNIKDLQEGKVDLIVTTMIVDSVAEPRVKFTEPYARSWQVLVRHDPDQAKTTMSDLGGDTVSVLANSFYYNKLTEFNDTTKGAHIVIDPIEHYDVEQIIQLVAEREIKQTLALEMIVRANRWYYPNLDYSVPFGDEYDLAWAVRPSAKLLQNDINSWLKKFKQTPSFKTIFRKYVIDPREHHNDIQSTSFSTYRSDYEAIIKKYAKDKRFNWVMISSIIYQESHFLPTATSWAGAYGLMQLMPETARRFGVTDLEDTEQNIAAGIRFIGWLDKRLKEYVPDPEERIKFTLAAYNVGLGHIMDAIRLAEKLGLKPDVWYGNVEVALLHKANPSYWTDPVVKHGYCQGTETINYVRSIIERYKNYKAKLKVK